MRAPAVSAIALALAASASCDRRADAPARPILVFTAASMTDAVEHASEEFTLETGSAVHISAAASSTLARQILAGADADVFISADQRWMDELEAAGRIVASSRADLAANRLVFVAPAGESASFALDADPPAIRALALADPTHVPAGRYAQEALEWLGWWPALADRAITTPDVRAALRLVEIGEADVGVVYATDARISKRVAVLAIVPESAHTPIRYPAAMCADAHPDAAAFLRHLRSGRAAATLEAAGFSPLATETEAPPR